MAIEITPFYRHGKKCQQGVRGERHVRKCHVAPFDTGNKTGRLRQVWDREEDERMTEAITEFGEKKNVFATINEKKAADPDSMNGELLKVRADELSFIYTYLCLHFQIRFP
ncbi:hypothetical protein ElyMa_001344200 [Elysia marginata]|uniref:Uncharacterized protein n=1 Tax=Elysia marginata TaxID=1093978 RepID=A0AAV4IN91_9GAST|nr:hypothetical protein ElyMa_001344200 [Elysia marginata]